MKSLYAILFVIFISCSASAREAVFHGQPVFDFKVRFGSVTAEDRADLLEKRMKELTALPAISEKSYRHEVEGETEALMYDKTVLMVISSEDALALGKEKSEIAKETLTKIQNLVQEERDRKEPIQLAIAAGLVLLTTLVLFIALRLLRLLKMKVLTKVNAWEFKLKVKLLKSFPLVDDRLIKKAIIFLIKTINVVAIFLLIYFYIPIVFSFLPWTSGWSEKIFSYVLHPIVWIWHGILNLLPNVFFIVVIALFTRYLLRMLKFIFGEISRERLRIDGFYPEWAEPTYKLVRILVFMMAFVVCFPYIPGSSSPAFQGLSVFLGLLVSLGSSSAISNVVAGVVITYMRPFKVGDRVKIADTMGDVVEKDLLVTRICTVKKMEVTIPNSMILSSHIVNYSSMAREGGLILHTTVTIGYEVPWPLVQKTLLEAARRTKGVLEDPKPFVLQTALNDFNVAYELNAYTHEEQRMLEIYSDLHSNIQSSFAEANIEIMSPKYLAMRDGNEITIPKI